MGQNKQGLFSLRAETDWNFFLIIRMEFILCEVCEEFWYRIRANVCVENGLWSIGTDSAISREGRITGAFTLCLLVFRIMKTKDNSSVIAIQYRYLIISIILLTQFVEIIVSTILLFIHNNVSLVRLKEKCVLVC